MPISRTRRALVLSVIGGLALPHVARAAPARVVVVGAGVAGASFATYAARLLKGVGEIVLVEPAPGYLALYRSNLVLGGIIETPAIWSGYDALARRTGIKWVAARAARFDRSRREVVLTDGARLGYDLAIVAPGIGLDYGSVPGWSREVAAIMPHAWKGTEQFHLLKRQLDAVPDGGRIVILPPPDPSRCPPAPYERASMMAFALKASGRGGCRIFIVDVKERFAKMALFLDAWEKYYPGMIDWLPPSIHEGVKQVDPLTMSVETGFETFRDCALVNVIPAQTASQIAVASGLADATGFCPVGAWDMRSLIDSSIFVLGDAAHAGAMPKSAFAANSQAMVAARTIAAELLAQGSAPPDYESRCWSLLAKGDSVKSSSNFIADDNKFKEYGESVSVIHEEKYLRQVTADESSVWFDRLENDLFM
ncbi:FAD-dependent oxidoreductase [Ancylobacter radicis]|uniref:FAD-dependent oxidoreductase n=1 Tax=Ancylobacter radicis TaxID=2836179 RepID=UPI001BCB9776